MALKNSPWLTKFSPSKGYTNAKNRYGVIIFYDQGKYNLTIKLKIISYTELQFLSFLLCPLT